MNYFDNLFLQYFLLFCATSKNPPVLVTANRQILLLCGITTRVRYPITVRRYISFSRYESSVLNKFRYLAATNSVTKVLYYLQSSYLCRASFRFIDSSLSFPCIPCSFVYLYLEIGKQILNEFLCNKTQTTRCSIMSKIIS